LTRNVLYLRYLLPECRGSRVQLFPCAHRLAIGGQTENLWPSASEWMWLLRSTGKRRPLQKWLWTL